MIQRFLRWLQHKSAPAPSLWRNGWIDAYHKHREPTALDLLGELKNTAWSCASVNAAVCASFPPRLYVATSKGRQAKCATKAIDRGRQEQLRGAPHLHLVTKAAEQIEEVVDHPLLTLLRSVNPVHNSFDLWELTQFYLEVHGSAYWLLETNAMLGIPEQIWILPSQHVRVVREVNSSRLVDYYEYRGGATPVRYTPEQIIHFRFPNPRDPYMSGLSPLRACYEQVALTSEYAAMKRSIYDNAGVPSVVLSPAEDFGEEERDRLEQQWNDNFRRGGSGRVLVADSGLKVDVLSHSMGDLAALADMKATKEDIANAFHVPLPFLSGQTNLANMQAADHLHKALAIRPRLVRRDEKLNEQLIPLYDPSGRLFLASDDPTPMQRESTLKEREMLLKYGVMTINEVRSDMGLGAVAWGDAPKKN
ncbi:MAG TPA: phage portal protein [Gemmataceae bacterium]|nr:phage portal protein [Gemmataceae bacterium]